ncbi:hypothetical protein KQH41_00015 [bacterium]|nr:hypothetical protein [bacterium]
MFTRLTLILACLFPLSAEALTVSGSVSGTWSAGDSPVLVEADIAVVSDATLSIEPGVEVRFGGPFSLTVAGTLVAVGTAAQPIIFTRATEEITWRGIRFVGADDASILELCRIEHTRRDGSVAADVRGGAVAISGCSPTIRSCLITANYTRNTNRNGAGAAIFVDGDSTSLIEFNRLAGNASDSGGALYVGGDSRPTIYHNLIENNEATYAGGGIYVAAWAEADIEANIIRNNSAGYWGGGGITLWNNTCAGESCTRVFNNIITGNAAASTIGQFFGNGGAVYCRYNESHLFNNTIVGNSAAGEGGGIYVLNQGNTIPHIGNSIIRDNTAPLGPQISLDASTTSLADVTFSNVQGGWTGTGNIDGASLFSNPAIGDFQLLPGSPDIDGGSNALLGPVANDFGGRDRIIDGDEDTTPTVDIGAFEFDPSAPLRGDIDTNQTIDLRDTILILKLLAGQDIGLSGDVTGSDVNGDRVIGLAEAIFTLQYLTLQP